MDGGARQEPKDEEKRSRGISGHPPGSARGQRGFPRRWEGSEWTRTHTAGLGSVRGVAGPREGIRRGRSGARARPAALAAGDLPGGGTWTTLDARGDRRRRLLRPCAPAREPRSLPDECTFGTGTDQDLPQRRAGAERRRPRGRARRLLRAARSQRGREDDPHRHHHLAGQQDRSEEHTSELQSQSNLVCRLLLEKKKQTITKKINKPN